MNKNFHEQFMEPQMDTAHRFLIEPQNTQNNTEEGLFDFLCVPWLKNYSAFITHISTLDAGRVSVFSDQVSVISEKWKLKPEKRLKEIQR